MPEYTVCATVTEETISSFKLWLESIETAIANFDAEILLALPKGHLSLSESDLCSSKTPIKFVSANSTSPAKLWSKVLGAARSCESEYLIFADTGSTLEFGALSKYRETLKSADFTYADVRFEDQDHNDTPATLFKDAAVADEIKRIEQLFDRNWLSFVNTAMRRASMPAQSTKIPVNIKAPAWWFFSTLIRGGQKGIVTDGVTTTIVETTAETKRPAKGVSCQQMLEKCATALQHYRSFAACDELMKNRAEFLENLIEKMSIAPENFVTTVAKAFENAKLWHEEVGLLLTPDNGARNVTAPVALLKYSKPDSFATCSTLIKELHNMGVMEGDILMPHVSLRSIGYVIGGNRTVLNALYSAVGDDGTIVMPAFSGELTDPSTWFKPPVPKKWHAKIRDEMPAFDPKSTPSSHIGATAELFRTEPDTLRSTHPVSSFTARGAHASKIIAEHPLNCRFGAKSPLGKLRELGGKALLIGAPFEHLTILHLTSFELGSGITVDQKSPIISGGKKKWVSYTDLSVTGSWFKDAVTHLIESGVAKIGTIHNAQTLLVPIPEAIETTMGWRKKNNV